MNKAKMLNWLKKSRWQWQGETAKNWIPIFPFLELAKSFVEINGRIWRCIVQTDSVDLILTLEWQRTGNVERSHFISFTNWQFFKWGQILCVVCKIGNWVKTIFHQLSTIGTYQKSVSTGWFIARRGTPHRRSSKMTSRINRATWKKAKSLKHDLQSRFNRTANKLEMLNVKGRKTTIIVSSSPVRIQVSRNFSVVEHTFMLSEHKFCERSQSFFSPSG